MSSERTVMCPFSQKECYGYTEEYACSLWGDFGDGGAYSCCAFAGIADTLACCSIGIKTYAEEKVCVGTDPYRETTPFEVVVL